MLLNLQLYVLTFCRPRISTQRKLHPTRTDLGELRLSPVHGIRLVGNLDDAVISESVSSVLPRCTMPTSWPETGPDAASVARGRGKQSTRERAWVNTEATCANPTSCFSDEARLKTRLSSEPFPSSASRLKRCTVWASVLPNNTSHIQDMARISDTSDIPPRDLEILRRSMFCHAGAFRVYGWGGIGLHECTFSVRGL